MAVAALAGFLNATKFHCLCISRVSARRTLCENLKRELEVGTREGSVVFRVLVFLHLRFCFCWSFSFEALPSRQILLELTPTMNMFSHYEVPACRMYVIFNTCKLKQCSWPRRPCHSSFEVECLLTGRRIFRRRVWQGTQTFPQEILQYNLRISQELTQKDTE